MNQWPKISELLDWDFSVNGNLDIYNEYNQLIYREEEDGTCTRWFWDHRRKNYLLKDSNGFWSREYYSSDGKLVYSCDSEGYEMKYATEPQITQAIRESRLRDLLPHEGGDNDQIPSHPPANLNGDQKKISQILGLPPEEIQK